MECRINGGINLKYRHTKLYRYLINIHYRNLYAPKYALRYNIVNLQRDTRSRRGNRIMVKQWERFEVKVINKLEDLGFKCIRSCYLEFCGITSQIDIVAISKYGVLAVECKSHTLDMLMKSNYGNSLVGYKDGIQIFNEDVLKQCENHRKQVFLTGVDMELALEKQRFAPVTGIVVFNKIGKLFRFRPDYAKRVFDISTLNTDRLKDILFGAEIYDEVEVSAIYNHFEQFSDTSAERLQKHTEYIKHCKETHTGMWSKEQIL